MAADRVYVRAGNRGAYALFEVIAVIGIIAVLMAVLLPLLARAQDRKHPSSCLDNEHQIALALLQYGQDFDDNNCLSWSGPDHDVSDPATGKYKWMDSIYPYVRNEQVFDCPEDSSAMRHPYRYYKNLTAPSDLNYGTYRINFAYYQSIPAFEPPAGNMASEPWSHIVVPADTVWVVEGDATNPRCERDDTCPYDMAWPYPTTSVTIQNSSPRQLVSGDALQNIVERHDGQTNVLWCDGHVTSCALDYLNDRHTVNGQSILYRFTVEND